MKITPWCAIEKQHERQGRNSWQIILLPNITITLEREWGNVFLMTFSWLIFGISFGWQRNGGN